MSEHIDFILPSLSTGGAERVVLLLAEQFKKRKYKVRFIVRCLKGGGFEEEVRREFELVDLKAKQVRHFPVKLGVFYRNNPKPDVVIVNLWPLTFLTALVACFFLRDTKIFTVEHGSLKYQVRKKSRWYRYFLKASLYCTLFCCHKMIAVSEGLRDELKQITGYKGEKIMSIPNPIALNLEEKEEKKITETEIALHGAIFLFVGRLKKVKNVPLLLKSFQKVSAEVACTLLIVGDGTERDKLQAEVQELQIEQQVHFLGFQQNMTPYYNRADTLVLSSDSEGFGNVIVEALMKGCTVVATDCPYGPREILAGGKYGYLSPVGNVEKLAENMIKSIHKPIEKDLAIERGMQYTPEVVFQQYLKEINRID